MALLGFRTMAEMIGRVDRLDVRHAVDHWKAKGLDLSPLLHRPAVGPEVAIRKVVEQDHGLEKSLDMTTLVPAVPARARARRAGRRAPAHPQRQPHGGHHPGLRGDLAARRGGAARRHHPPALHGLGRPELRRLRAQGHHPHPRGRRQRLPRQGPVRRQDRRLPAARGDVRARGEHPRRQRGPLRGHRRRGLLPRGGGRAVRRAQQRRRHRGGGRGRPRLRVHDGRPRGGDRPHRAQLRGGHVGRHRLRARRGGRLQAPLQPRHGRPRAPRGRGGRRAGQGSPLPPHPLHARARWPRACSSTGSGAARSSSRSCPRTTSASSPPSRRPRRRACRRTRR